MADTCFVTYKCADSAGEMVDFGVWGLFATPRRPSDATAANFKSSTSGALKLGGEGRNITVARPTKLEHVTRGSFEVVPN